MNTFGITFVVETMRVTVVFLFVCVTLAALTEVKAAELEKAVRQTIYRKELYCVKIFRHKNSSWR